MSWIHPLLEWDAPASDNQSLGISYQLSLEVSFAWWLLSVSSENKDLTLWLREIADSKRALRTLYYQGFVSDWSAEFVRECLRKLYCLMSRSWRFMMPCLHVVAPWFSWYLRNKRDRTITKPWVLIWFGHSLVWLVSLHLRLWFGNVAPCKDFWLITNRRDTHSSTQESRVTSKLQEATRTPYSLKI